ncbi:MULTISPECIES: hypothetical protein [Bacteria]|uniref:DUF7336 domain-containing protein n=1 Tax=Bacteria TaxID=2 RepID=UPI003701EE12
MPQTVHLLYHIHEFSDIDREDDVKLIGVYLSREDAEAAQRRAEILPGFKDDKEGFQIHPYTVGEDHWKSGFETIIYRDK